MTAERVAQPIGEVGLLFLAKCLGSLRDGEDQLNHRRLQLLDCESLG